MMGGRIWVESQVGRGSVFRFTVQVTLPSPTPAPPAAGRLAVLSGRRALIVDDNASSRDILSAMVTASVWRRKRFILVQQP